MQAEFVEKPGGISDILVDFVRSDSQADLLKRGCVEAAQTGSQSAGRESLAAGIHGHAPIIPKLSNYITFTYESTKP